MKKRGRLITMGSFDGVHRGHQALLGRVLEEARKRQLRPLVLTFKVPPRMILNRAHPLTLINDPFEKDFLIRKTGIDDVRFLPFGKKIARIRPFIFFRDELFYRYKAKGIVIGSDFRFGAERSAGALELVRWGQEYEIPVWVIPHVKWQRKTVSSSLIRNLFDSGRYGKAVGFLGHPHVVHGRVVKGRGMGRKIGFPTANLKTPSGKILPRGVFAVRGKIAVKHSQLLNNRNIKSFQGVCNIGVRPTLLKTGKLSVEVHMLTPTGPLKKKIILMELLARLRSEKRFSSVRKLTAQIKKDIKKAKNVLRTIKKEPFAVSG